MHIAHPMLAVALLLCSVMNNSARKHQLSCFLKPVPSQLTCTSPMTFLLSPRLLSIFDSIFCASLFDLAALLSLFSSFSTFVPVFTLFQANSYHRCPFMNYIRKAIRYVCVSDEDDKEDGDHVEEDKEDGVEEVDVDEEDDDGVGEVHESSPE